MDWGTRIFWGLVTVLLGATLVFYKGAAELRAQERAAEVVLKTGDLVRVAEIVDGDSLVVTDANGAKVGVRVLGIKTFNTKPERDAATRFGREAVAAVQELTKDEPVRVLVHTTEKDKNGRTLATLFVADEDLGLTLIKRGLALNYTAYPVPQTPMYQAAQEEAKSAKKGLWADAEVAARAVQMAREWSRGSQ